MKKKIISGKATRDAPDIAIPKSIIAPPAQEIVATPTVRVLEELDPEIIKGHRKFSQEPTKANMLKAATKGLEIGITIKVKILNSPAPSILAASRISEGKVLIYCLAKNIPPALQAEGRNTAGKVSYKPKLFIVANRGIRVI